MKRILLVSSRIYPSFGGVEVLVDKLAKKLVKKGNTVTVISNFFRSPVPGIRGFREFINWYKSTFKNRFLAMLGIGDTTLGYKVIETYFIFFGISRIRSILSLVLFPITFLHFVYLILITRPEVINLHFVDNSAIYVLLIKLFFPRIKLVTSVHGSDVSSLPKRSRIQMLILKATIKVSDSVISVSNYLKTELESVVGFSAEKCQIIYNGIEHSWYKGVKSEGKMNKRGKYILAYGRLFQVKGFDLLIEAFRKFERKTGKVVKLAIIGSGDELDSLKKQASGLWVEFLGPKKRDEIKEYIVDSLFVVTPSRSETFGLVNLEIMSLGAPLLASNVGGIPEYVIDMKNGLLFESENVDDLYLKMIKMYSSKSLRSKLGKEAKNSITKKFTFNKIVSKYEKIYEE